MRCWHEHCRVRRTETQFTCRAHACTKANAHARTPRSHRMSRTHEHNRTVRLPTNPARFVFAPRHTHTQCQISGRSSVFITTYAHAHGTVRHDTHACQKRMHARMNADACTRLFAHVSAINGTNLCNFMRHYMCRASTTTWAR